MSSETCEFVLGYKHYDDVTSSGILHYTGQPVAFTLLVVTVSKYLSRVGRLVIMIL